MGEFRVHRVGFYDYCPSAVHCLAYEATYNKLAVSRADGSIEIWNLKENWVQEKVLPPTDGASVEAVLWCGQRLFAAGLHGNIQEFDLLTGKLKRAISSNNGPVWCLALKEDATKLAAGTEEGCVVLYNTTSEDLEYHTSLSRQPDRILSLAWYSAENVIVTGGVDNIRVWSLTSGHAIQRLTLSRVDNNTETIVWAIAITQDFTIVSGDSSGKTSFWNGRQGTLIKSYKSHRADVLCLCVSEDGDSVYSSGVDPALTRFQYVSSTPTSDLKMWVRSSVRTHHTHDVRTLVMVNNDVLSGGVDTQLILNRTDSSRPNSNSFKRDPSMPQAPTIYTARSANMVMLRYADYLEVWSLGTTDHKSQKSGEVLPLSASPIKLLQLKSRDSEFITSAAISHNAEWIVYSDQHTIRLFQLDIEESELGAPRISINRVRCTPSDVEAAHRLTFTADGAYLISATLTGNIQIVKPNAIQLELVHTIKSHTTEPVSIHVLAVCPRGKYLATADLHGNVHIYNIKKAKYVVSLPDTTQVATALAFHPSKPILLVVYTNRQVLEFSIADSSYTEWTRTYMYKFPVPWKRSPYKILQAMYNPHNDNQILLRDIAHFTILDKTQPFPTNAHAPVNHENREAAKTAFHTCTKFKFLLHIDLLDDDFLLAVERTPASLSENLPETLKYKKFGT